MDTFLYILKVIGLILLVLLSFNIIIFVHELGHFLAARWRGLHVDKFQIWFGKPIWKKTINGVQYGLGTIPAGGFVALPQMAPMEAIEGKNDETEEPLPPITPMDKIIVAFAGPLFSFLLAVIAAFIVWGIGVPDTNIKTNEVGFIQPDMPAQAAGFQLGDKILEVQGTPVNGFRGNLDSITELIIFSKGDTIDFLVDRNGEQMTLTSEFQAKDGSLTQRRGMRRVGLAPAEQLVMGETIKGSPASVCDIVTGDIVVSINGEKIYSYYHFADTVKKLGETPFTLRVIRNSKQIDIKTMALKPNNEWRTHNKAEVTPILGVGFIQKPPKLIYPNPGKQLADTSKLMFTTISSLISPSSSIGLDQMQGPVGIGKLQYQFLDSPFPVNYIFYFWVAFNINLAIFNMLPFPVLDGGHITMALSEMIRKKPLNTRVLESIQVVCVLLLFSMFLYVTIKDIFHKDELPNREGLPTSPTFDLDLLKETLTK